MVKNSSFAGKNSRLSFDKRMECPKIQNSRQSFGVQIYFSGVNNDDSEIAAPNCLLLQLEDKLHIPVALILIVCSCGNVIVVKNQPITSLKNMQHTARRAPGNS